MYYFASQSLQNICICQFPALVFDTGLYNEQRFLVLFFLHVLVHIFKIGFSLIWSQCWIASDQTFPSDAILQSIMLTWYHQSKKEVHWWHFVLFVVADCTVVHFCVCVYSIAGRKQKGVLLYVTQFTKEVTYFFNQPKLHHSLSKNISIYQKLK